MGNVSSTTASTIVTTVTSLLITEANNIVANCVGTNCNTSEETQSLIVNNLNRLAVQESEQTLFFLSIPSNSQLGVEIANAYQNLASSVSASYNFSCGNIIFTSFPCILSSSAVAESQSRLRQLILPPITELINRNMIMGFLGGIIVIFFFSFVIFLIIFLFYLLLNRYSIGMNEFITTTVRIITPQKQNIQQPYPKQISSVGVSNSGMPNSVVPSQISSAGAMNFPRNKEIAPPKNYDNPPIKEDSTIAIPASSVITELRSTSDTYADNGSRATNLAVPPTLAVLPVLPVPGNSVIFNG